MPVASNMGKRSRDGSKDTDSKKIKKTRNNQKQTQSGDSSATIQLSDTQAINDKPRKIVFDDNGTPMTNQAHTSQNQPIIQNKVLKKEKTSKVIKNKTKPKNNNKNKKIICGNDDEAQEIPLGRTNNAQSNQSEDEVKEEDIDKFCDEIDEEDNEQYESWVKLIETKLNSNKKKS